MLVRPLPRCRRRGGYRPAWSCSGRAQGRAQRRTRPRPAPTGARSEAGCACDLRRLVQWDRGSLRARGGRDQLRAARERPDPDREITRPEEAAAVVIGTTERLTRGEVAEEHREITGTHSQYAV